MFTLSLLLSLSSHNCIRSKQARARVCMCVCKKGKKIGFALLRSIALVFFFAHSLLRVGVFCLVVWVCAMQMG